jgi:hypothetical protein
MAIDVGFDNDVHILARFGSASISKGKKLCETGIWDALENDTPGDPTRELELTVEEVLGPAISLMSPRSLPELNVTISAASYCELHRLPPANGLQSNVDELGHRASRREQKALCGIYTLGGLRLKARAGKWYTASLV